MEKPTIFFQLTKVDLAHRTVTVEIVADPLWREKERHGQTAHQVLER